MRSPGAKLAGAWLCLLALLMTLGTHWYVLQSIAWARMLATYSRSAPLREAVTQTFDGQHPCSLCLTIQAGRDREEREQQNDPSLKSEPRADWWFERALVLPQLPWVRADDAVPFVPGLPGEIPHTPPKPPPRLLPAV